MLKYKITIEGSNFWLEIDEQHQRLGFYKTYFIEAESEETAEMSVMDSLQNHPKLKGQVLNDKNDPPEMRLYEIQEIDNFDGIKNLEQGFMFYPEEDSDQ